MSAAVLSGSGYFKPYADTVYFPSSLPTYRASFALSDGLKRHTGWVAKQTVKSTLLALAALMFVQTGTHNGLKQARDEITSSAAVRTAEDVMGIQVGEPRLSLIHI